MSRDCPVCGGRLTRSVVPGALRHDGPLAATVEPRHVATCAAHGDPRPAAAVRTQLLDAIAAQIVTASAGGRGDRCGACDRPLDLPLRATTRSITVGGAVAGTVGGTVGGPEGAPYTVTFTLPVARCGDCAQDNVPGPLGDRLVRLALETCGVTDPSSGERRLSRMLGRLRRRV